MKITLAQLNYHIGNFEKNKELIMNAINRAKDEMSDLVVFSELCVSGYPPLDLLDRADFIEKCENSVAEIADHCRGIAAIVGSPVFNRNREGKKLFNSALLLSEGKIIYSANKALLPTYDIFDEYRYFEPEREFGVCKFKGLKMALTICEDLWDEQPFDNKLEKSRLYTVSPMERLSACQPDLVINISASPFSYNKIEARRNIFVSKAKKYRVPVIAVNQTGANTELIFDGASLVVDAGGRIFTSLKSFTEEIVTIDLADLMSGNGNQPDSEQPPDTVALIHDALVLGIRDYFAKTGFKRALIGLSGGIDSAVCLCLAVEALGSENLLAVLMPSRYSSEHSVTDARLLAQNLGVRHEFISIEKPFSAFENILSDIFRGRETDITEENIQARIRAVILMAISNKLGYILLNTSNKSEAAVGYGTLYGDMAGGLSLIGDVLKTGVYRLAGYINRNGGVIPENIMTKAPSAELKPGQFDSDSLPPYGVLDSILHQYIELQRSPDDFEMDGFGMDTVNRVLKLINSNEYKRYQAPPILRISSKAFGDGWKMPLVARY
jgi:NAD+ synthase (glutamine-hydrolysing)